MTRRVSSPKEAADLTERAASALEAAIGPGGCIVIVPVEVDGQTFMSVLAKGKDIDQQLELMRGGLPAFVQHFAHTHKLKTGQEAPDLDPMGVGKRPPPDVFSAAHVAMEILRASADGVVLIVHRHTEEGEILKGGVMAVVNNKCEHGDEFERLAEMAPKIASDWAAGVLEIVKGRGKGPMQ
jgi:hypothetical protein